jgi:hypothetical protein
VSAKRKASIIPLMLACVIATTKSYLYFGAEMLEIVEAEMVFKIDVMRVKCVKLIKDQDAISKNMVFVEWFKDQPENEEMDC